MKELTQDEVAAIQRVADAGDEWAIEFIRQLGRSQADAERAKLVDAVTQAGDRLHGMRATGPEYVRAYQAYRAAWAALVKHDRQWSGRVTALPGEARMT